MRVSNRWSRAVVRSAEENLVSCAGLVPVMALAERSGLSDLVADTVRISDPPVASTGPDAHRCWAGIDRICSVDIDSLLRRVMGTTSRARRSGTPRSAATR